MRKAQIKLNTDDWGGMLKIMKEYGDTTAPFYGKTEDNEDIYINVFSDRIHTTVFQNNHWVRENTYYNDFTVDETFNGRW